VPVVLRVLVEQRRSEGSSPWWRQPRQDSIGNALQKVTEADECQGELGFGRARRKDANSTCAGMLDPLSPDRRLADPCLTLEDQPSRRASGRVDECIDLGELLLPAYNLGGHRTATW